VNAMQEWMTVSKVLIYKFGSVVISQGGNKVEISNHINAGVNLRFTPAGNSSIEIQLAQGCDAEALLTAIVEQKINPAVLADWIQSNPEFIVRDSGSIYILPMLLNCWKPETEIRVHVPVVRNYGNRSHYGNRHR